MKLKKAQWPKSESFGKRKEFLSINAFNFALVVGSQFHTRNGLIFTFVLFEAERDHDAGGILKFR